MEAKYQRIILKISGEALSGNGQNIDFDVVRRVAKQVVEVNNMGVAVGIIVGGGNIWRGRQGRDMDRVTADHMGMLATVINSLALQDALEALGVSARVQTAIEMRQIAEPFVRRRAMRHLEKGRVVIFACGTGNPLILLAKNVDGIYDSDPKENSNAVRYNDISYMEVIERELKAMDTTAITLCMENDIPIMVFALAEENSIVRAVLGEQLGTLIS